MVWGANVDLGGVGVGVRAEREWLGVGGGVPPDEAVVHIDNDGSFRGFCSRGGLGISNDDCWWWWWCCCRGLMSPSDDNGIEQPGCMRGDSAGGSRDASGDDG